MNPSSPRQSSPRAPRISAESRAASATRPGLPPRRGAAPRSPGPHPLHCESQSTRRPANVPRKVSRSLFAPAAHAIAPRTPAPSRISLRAVSSKPPALCRPAAQSVSRPVSCLPFPPRPDPVVQASLSPRTSLGIPPVRPCPVLRSRLLYVDSPTARSYHNKNNCSSCIRGEFSCVSKWGILVRLSVLTV
jgi:hypothetical protein